MDQEVQHQGTLIEESGEDARVMVTTELSARVLRCTCKHPENHPGVPCPQARVVDLGVLAYWHRNPVKRVWGRLTKGVYKRNLLAFINKLTEV